MAQGPLKPWLHIVVAWGPNLVAFPMIGSLTQPGPPLHGAPFPMLTFWVIGGVQRMPNSLRLSLADASNVFEFSLPVSSSVD